MTVTIAKILTAEIGRDIHKHGDFAGCVGEDERERDFKIPTSKTSATAQRQSVTGRQKPSWSSPEPFGKLQLRPYNPHANLLPHSKSPEAQGLLRLVAWRDRRRHSRLPSHA